MEVSAIATRRRKATRRRTAAPAARSVASAIKPPEPGPGERLFLLDVPYESRAVAQASGARWHKGTGWVFTGTSLPPPLRPYQPQPYSWTRWQEDDYRGKPSTTAGPDPTTGAFTLRRDQLLDVRLILEARAARAPEFLNGSDVGSGKTPSVIAAIKRMANVRNVLVVCPLPVAPGWRLHLDQMGDGGKRWCVINYESTKKLLTPPPKALAAKKTRTKNLHTVRDGIPKVAWDVVITDEAHNLGNPESQQSRTVDRIIAGPGGDAAFVIRMSATAGSDPSQLSYLYRALHWSQGMPVPSSITADGYQQWCAARGITLTRGQFGNSLQWDGSAQDLEAMHAMIFKTSPSWAVRRRPEWPEQQRIPVPVELTHEEMQAYQVEWALFQEALKQAQRARQATAAKRTTSQAQAEATARAKGMAAQVRYRQKAGQVRAAGTAGFVAEMVKKGRQVAVSCEYLGTVNAVMEHLASSGVKAVSFTGENRDTREEQRVAYQRGHAQVIVYTPTEGFNLHAGETSVGGNSVPRVTVIAEPRWSPKKALQSEGRSARNGTEAPAYYPYALNTVEEKVITTVIDGMRNTSVINGDDTAPFDALASALGVPMVFGTAA